MSVAGKNNMPRIESIMRGDQIVVQSIAGVLDRKHLPKEYLNHVPYMYFIPEDNSLFINYVGGIDYIYVGHTYDSERYNRLMEYAHRCYTKLNNIETIPNKENLESIKWNIDECLNGSITYKELKTKIKERLNE